VDDDRLWAKIDATGPCWLWTGALDTHGYGHVCRDGRDLQTHRAVYEILVGPIPPGLTLDHLCRVRRCCNPDHVEVVTRTENLQRSPIALAGRPRQTHCARGHELNADNIYRNTRGSRQCKTCAKERARKQPTALQSTGPRTKGK
jgi:HNH endonuclease